VVLCLVAAAPAFSREASPQQSASTPCAVLKDFEGEVEVLDASRVALVHTQKDAGIPCGGWVSISHGWAKLKHRDGHWFRLGPDSFAEITESNALGENQGDHLVLFRGELWADADTGAGDLRIVTANGRVKMNDAAALVVFSPDEQETQVITLANKAVFENRFEASRVVTVHAGEASSLNFGLLRVIPSQPKAVSVASLRGLLAAVHANDGEQTRAIAAAQLRGERKFAAELTPNPDEPQRKPASIDEDGNESESEPVKAAKTGKKSKVPASDDTQRHKLSAADKARFRKHMVNRMTAGEPVGERMLFPDKYYGHPQQVEVHVEDPEAALNAKKKHAEDAEKKRLIEELSQIKDN
jgi:hypothetical protein